MTIFSWMHTDGYATAVAEYDLPVDRSRNKGARLGDAARSMFPLIVFSNLGERIVDQNPRIRGEYVIMLGMLPGQAFIARSASEASRSDPLRIVSRSLSSGLERAPLNSDLPLSRGDAAGRHLVFGGDGPAGPPTAMTSPNCWVRIVDVTDLTGNAWISRTAYACSA